MESMYPLVPAEWSWEGDAVAFYQRNSLAMAIVTALYYPAIFGIQHVMKGREPFDLGGFGSKATLNYIFWWELGLVLFSIVGALHVVPLAIAPILVGVVQ